MTVECAGGRGEAIDLRIQQERGGGGRMSIQQEGKRHCKSGMV